MEVDPRPARDHNRSIGIVDIDGDLLGPPLEEALGQIDFGMLLGGNSNLGSWESPTQSNLATNATPGNIFNGLDYLSTTSIMDLQPTQPPSYDESGPLCSALKSAFPKAYDTVIQYLDSLEKDTGPSGFLRGKILSMRQHPDFFSCFGIPRFSKVRIAKVQARSRPIRDSFSEPCLPCPGPHHSDKPTRFGISHQLQYQGLRTPPGLSYLEGASPLPSASPSGIVFSNRRQESTGRMSAMQIKTVSALLTCKAH